ncbi:hypothetical protein VmeM32_00135 [Vibrio phage vB_VmeM-32]|nr:hypothetical protein VmeM32_00135 [Vibrio phage vB_VmeM-32]
MFIDILQAVPASGKTKTIMRHVTKSKKKTLIASISCDLNLQSYEWYINNGGYGAIIIDSEHVTKSETVCDVIKQRLRDNEHRVFFITHSALIKIDDYSIFEGFELFIDEVPDLIELKHMKFVDHIHLVTDYTIEENGMLRIDNSKKNEVIRKYYDAMDNRDTVSVALIDFYRALINNEIIIRRKDEIYFISDQARKNWEAFSNITIACCEYDNTFTGTIMRECYNWKSTRSKLTDKLDFAEYKNTQRINIHPLLRNNDWSKYYADSVVSDNKSVYSIIKEHVIDFFGNIPFIYSTNSYRGNLNSIFANRVGYNPHGMNNFMSYSNAAALFSYNPSPWQRNLLKHLSLAMKLDENKLLECFVEDKYLMPIFQFVTRTDIRNYHSERQINLIVPDMRAANYLRRYFKNAVIDTSYCLDIEIEKQNNKSTTFPALFNMTGEEKVKFAYFKRKNNLKKLSVNNKDDVDIVRNFINTIRFI